VTASEHDYFDNGSWSAFDDELFSNFAAKNAGPDLQFAPNKVYGFVSGRAIFYDSGAFPVATEDISLSRRLDLAYSVNTQTGQMTRNPGPVFSGTATSSGPLSIGLNFDELFDTTAETEHWVDVTVKGIVAVGGTVSWNAGVEVSSPGQSGTFGGSFEFGATEPWGTTRQFDNMIRLMAQKGATN